MIITATAIDTPTTSARQATPPTHRVTWSVCKGRSTKGQRKKQACKKKTDVGAKESKQKGQKLPEKKVPAQRTFVEEITNLASNIVRLGGGKPSSYGKDNHSAKCCQSTKRNRTHGVREEYEESSSDAGDINEESSSESDYIDCVTSTPDSISTVEHRESAQEIYAEMILKGKAIRFQVDSEATVNVLPAKYVGHEIYPTKKFLQMWNRSELKHEGVTRVKIRNPRNDKKYSVSSSL